MPAIICNQRTQAMLEGKPTYFTGKPCSRGHIAERRVSNYICVQCSKEVHQITDRNNYRDSNNTLERQFNTRKQTALRKGIPFTIKFEDIEQPEYCPVLGFKLNYGWSGEDRRDNAKATFDKVNPELGYVPGNVYIISWRANKLKSDMNIMELEKIMNYIKEKTNG
jgi:hypothetical protein